MYKERERVADRQGAGQRSESQRVSIRAGPMPDQAIRMHPPDSCAMSSHGKATSTCQLSHPYPHITRRERTHGQPGIHLGQKSRCWASGQSQHGFGHHARSCAVLDIMYDYVCLSYSNQYILIHYYIFYILELYAYMCICIYIYISIYIYIYLYISLSIYIYIYVYT